MRLTYFAARLNRSEAFIPLDKRPPSSAKYR
jgi:hypothetical protein